MRIFIAIPLAAGVRKKLKTLRFSSDAIRWQPTEQMHITLKFLGDLTQKQVNNLQMALSDISKAAFALTLKGWGTFPNEGRPKIIWARIEASEAIMELQQAVEEVCAAWGFERENRPFVPHVTLGRIKGSLSRNELENKMSAATDMLGVLTAMADCFCLYESELGPGGATHRPIKKYPLAP